jgi:hypothetical protein
MDVGRTRGLKMDVEGVEIKQMVASATVAQSKDHGTNKPTSTMACCMIGAATCESVVSTF